MISHVTPDLLAPETAAQANQVATKEAVHARSKVQIAAFLNGLDLVRPGIVPVSEWRAEPEPEPRPTPAEVGSFGAGTQIP